MKVGCVIVTYNPKLELLSEVVNSVISQVDEVYISDNSTEYIDFNDFMDDSQIIFNKHGENIGIAAAQNAGVEYFLSSSFSHVILLDQDSIMSAGLVKTLLDDLMLLQDIGVLVGGIGPSTVNKDDLVEYKKSIVVDSDVELTDISEFSEIMASSTLIPIGNFDIVGLFDEKLFIDGVDHEWCWRARYKGDFRFFISSKVNLYHKLGEGDRFLFFKKIAIPSPVRTFYQYRNYFDLLGRKYVPLKWKIVNGIKYIIKYFYYSLFVAPRKKYFFYINKGVFNGISNLIRR